MVRRQNDNYWNKVSYEHESNDNDFVLENVLIYTCTD